MLIVWDLRSDRKTSLIRHTSPITSLAFLSDTLLPLSLSFYDSSASIKGDSLILSIDSGINPTLCLWNWQNASLLKHTYLPLKASPRYLPIANSLLSLTRNRGVLVTSKDINPLIESPKFSLTRNSPRNMRQGGLSMTLALVLENESVQQRGYRLSVWSIGSHETSQVQTLLNSNQAKSKNEVMSLLFVNELQSSQTALDLSVISTSQNCSFVTVESRCVKFWQICDLHSVKLRKRVHIKQEVLRASCDSLTGFIVVLSRAGKILVLDTHGNYVSTIEKDNVRFTSVECQDSQQLMLGTSRGAIQIYNLASLRYVREIEYPLQLKQKYRLRNNSNKQSLTYEDVLIKAAGGPGIKALFSGSSYLLISYEDGSHSIYHRPGCSHLRYSSSHNGKISQLKWLQQTGQFMTVSCDLTVRIWKHFGDRWTSAYIDIPSAIDSSLQHFSSQDLTATQSSSLKLQAVAAHPKQNYIVCGDDRGVLRSFSLDSGDLLLTRDISSFSITYMVFTDDGELLIVAHTTGLVNVYETATSFAFLLQLESHFQDASGELFFQTILLHSRTKTVMQESQFFNTITSGQYKYNTMGGSTIQNNASESAQQAFVLHNSTTVRSYALLRHLAKRVSAQLLMEFEIKQGVVSGLSLHPSGDYITVLSNAGFFLIYRSDTAELRGRVNVPEFAYHCTIDPSGLYLVLSAPQPQTQGSGEVMNESSLTGVDFSQPDSSVVNTQSSRLLVFELGTGNFCTQLTSLFKVTSFDWSRDGRFLAIGGEQGIVSVWGVADSLSENIFRVLDAMRLDPTFWTSYPIYLDNSEIHFGSQNEEVTEIDMNQRKQTRTVERGVLTSPRFDEYEERGKKGPALRYEVQADDRSVKSIHSLRDDISNQELQIYHRRAPSPYRREEPRREEKRREEPKSTTRQHFEIGSQFSQQREQSRFVRVATPVRSFHPSSQGGVGVQTSERFFEKSNEKKQNKESYTQMARRFTREVSPQRRSPGPNKIYKNEPDQGRYSPRSAMSAVISNNPLMKEGVETKSVSHRPHPASQMTPRTLEPSFFVAQRNRPDTPPRDKVTHVVQKRRYGTPGRDLLDPTDAKELYPRSRMSPGTRHLQTQDEAVSTLLDKPLVSSISMRHDSGLSGPHYSFSRISRTRKIEPDPSDIDDDVGPSNFDKAVTFLSPLAAPGMTRAPQSGKKQIHEPRELDALRSGIRRDEEIVSGGQKVGEEQKRAVPQENLRGQELLPPVLPPISYELGVGQSLEKIKNYDPMLGYAVSNQGLESASRKSTAEVVEQLYSDLDAFEANLGDIRSEISEA